MTNQDKNPSTFRIIVHGEEHSATRQVYLKAKGFQHGNPYPLADTALYWFRKNLTEETSLGLSVLLSRLAIPHECLDESSGEVLVVSADQRWHLPMPKPEVRECSECRVPVYEGFGFIMRCTDELFCCNCVSTYAEDEAANNEIEDERSKNDDR